MTFKQPNISPIARGLYRLEEDYCYQWEHNGSHYRITVPAGFRYDGNSVPRIIWTLAGITPDGLNRAAGLVHDFIYRHCGKLPANSFQTLSFNDEWVCIVSNIWSRHGADRLYARLLRVAGVSSYRRRIAYRGVRIGGALTWYWRLAINHFSRTRSYS
jgi:hypothetical protein